MNPFSFIFQDWSVNHKNPKGRIILVLFRIANGFSKRKYLHYIGLPYRMFYRFVVEWLFTVEIPWNAQIGKNLTLYHGQSLVINSQVVIGNNCTLRHCTTIGNKQLSTGGFSGSPIIGNYVDVGSNVCIIGSITIHDNVAIGCGAVVLQSINRHCIAVGNPAVQKEKKLSKIVS